MAHAAFVASELLARLGSSRPAVVLAHAYVLPHRLHLLLLDVQLRLLFSFFSSARVRTGLLHALMGESRVKAVLLASAEKGST